MTITPSHIIEYLFCPRFTYFEYVLCIPQYEERHYKVEKGRNVHKEKLERNKNYLRKRLGAVNKYSDQYLTNDTLRGVIDEIIELRDGTMAPIDYKFAVYEDRIYETYKTQLFCYAILIEDNFHKNVNKAYLVYTRSKNKLIEIEVNANNKEIVRMVAKNVVDVIEKNIYPKATKYKKRCLTCTYRNICIK